MLWNVWVLLATPAVWIAWSMITFIIAILSYVWRSGSTDDPADGAWPRLSPTQSLGPRLFITAVVALGLVYFALIVKTFTQYGMGFDESRAVPVDGADDARGRERRAVPGVGLGVGLRETGDGAFVARGSRTTDLEKGDVAVELESQMRLTPKL
jgi:hypothetical protein